MERKNAREKDNRLSGISAQDLQTIQLKVTDDLYRAFQRCTWILINESGRSQLDIMEEVVEDFLYKYEC